MNMPLWFKLAIAALTWGGLLVRVEAQERIAYGRVTDSTVIASLAPYWSQRDSIEHVCVMGRARPLRVDSLRTSRGDDFCKRPCDIGAVALLSEGDGETVARNLPVLLVHRPDLLLLMAMVGPGEVVYAIRVSPE